MGRVDQIVDVLNGQDRSTKGGAKHDERKKVVAMAEALKLRAEKLLSSYTTAQTQVSQAVSLAQAQIEALDTALRKDLEALESGIKTAIKGYVGELSAALGKAAASSTDYGSSKSAISALQSSELKNMQTFNNMLTSAATSGIAIDIGKCLYHINRIMKSTRIAEPEKILTELQDAFEGKVAAKFTKKVATGGVGNQHEINIDATLVGYAGEHGKVQLKKKINAIPGKIGNLTVTNANQNGEEYRSVEREIEGLHNDLNNRFNDFIRAVRILVGDDNLWSTGVRHYLTRLKASLGKNDMNKVYGFEKGLEEIKTEIDTLRNNQLSDKPGSNIHTSVSHVSQQVGKLEAASEQSDNANSILISLVESLPNDMAKLSASIRGVIQVVEKADTQLGEWLVIVDAYINSLEHVGQQYVKQFSTELAKEISFTSSNITTAIRKRYVITIKRQLQYFAIVINDVLKPLPALVEQDKHIGFKGFMEKLYDSFNDNIVPKETKSVRDLSFAFQNFCSPLHAYLKAEIGRQNEDNHAKRHPSSQRPTNNYAAAVDCVQNELEKLVNQIRAGNRYDHHVPSLLDGLTDAIDGLHPESFSEPNTPLLETIAHGFRGLVGELRFAYISAYDCAAYDFKWDVDGRKCAKVCLSITPMVCDALNELKGKLDEPEGKWKNYTIYDSKASNHSLYRLFFNDNGYDLGLRGDAAHGELNHKAEINGNSILSKLMSDTHKLFVASKQPLDDQELTVVLVNEHGILEDLFDYLKNYFRVCHLGAPSKKHPCSVNEMLCWLTGLPHNGVYEKLNKHVVTLFEVPDKNDPTKKIVKPIDASPANLTVDYTTKAIDDICAKSYALLTTFVGTGDEATYYACEFPNNTLGLQYPSNPADCLDTLLDILRRIFPPLKFLFMQCGQPASENGWLKCLYGKNVKSSKWPCKEHSKSKSRCEPKCQPTCGPNDQPNCQPTSPLQSYLSDSLTGHLPHALTSIGCRAECNTCPKSKPGMPCITPLGFRGFSGSTKTGSYLSAIIGDFLEIENITTLFCLSPKTPKTLPEHFDFVSSLVRGWIDLSNSVGKSDVQYAFEESAKSLSIQLCDKPSELTDALCNAYGSESSGHLNCEQHHLLHLTSFNACIKKDKHCAPYMLPLCTKVYTCLPFKHSSTYLSWAIYLPWTFWYLLNNLYNAFCSINCQDWGCRGCLRSDKCKKGEHGVIEDVLKPNPTCQCTSIVDCKGVSPTLYQYGFVFGEASTLNDKTSPKKCSDFCSQLKNVLKSKYFIELFEECDNFLWKIREPFSYLVLALWLLSLLYLIHIMIIRLDLLHIKSHLHTPSSHRTAAQSLLAASRVNKLNRVFYLQP